MTESLRARHGLLTFDAVSLQEPVGKPLDLCSRRRITLTLDSDSDLRVLIDSGLGAMRRHRVERLTGEAIRQGAELRDEDLVRILTTSPSTIKRDIAHLREHGLRIRTRGRRE